MSDFHCRSLNLTLLALVVTGLAGCSSFDSASARVASIVSPYTVDIVQGNVVTREQIALIKPGMPRAQVRDILGTALVASVFHADRWDYVFTLKQKGKVTQSRKVTLFFKGEVLDHVDADELPSETEFVATLRSPLVLTRVPVLEATEEELKKYPLPNKSAAPTTKIVTAPVDYPPLETTRP